MRVGHLPGFAAAVCVAVCTACAAVRPVPPPRDATPLASGEIAGSRSARVDPGAAARVPLEVAGHVLLVRPLVNGVDAGWFILDTGASTMAIGSAAARRAGLAPCGSANLQGWFPTTVYAGERFRLGPLTLLGTRYVGLDLPHLTERLGREIAGFCGSDVFADAVIELDVPARSITVHDPATHELREGVWHPLIMHGSTPHLHCRFPGGEGLFMIDTGAGLGVAFFAHAVEAHGLLDGRATRRAQIVNLGEANEVRTGRLEFVELGGRRVDDVEAAFFLGPTSFDPGPSEVLGVIGLDVLRRLRVTLDYPGGRVAITGTVPNATAAR